MRFTFCREGNYFNKIIILFARDFVEMRMLLRRRASRKKLRYKIPASNRNQQVSENKRYSHRESEAFARYNLQFHRSRGRTEGIILLPRLVRDTEVALAIIMIPGSGFNDRR